MTEYTGTCARPGCVRPITERYFLCRRHWWLVPRRLRTTYWAAYRAWEHRYGDVGKVRAAQEEILAAVVARSTS